MTFLCAFVAFIAVVTDDTRGLVFVDLVAFGGDEKSNISSLN